MIKNKTLVFRCIMNICKGTGSGKIIPTLLTRFLPPDWLTHSFFKYPYHNTFQKISHECGKCKCFGPLSEFTPSGLLLKLANSSGSYKLYCNVHNCFSDTLAVLVSIATANHPFSISNLFYFSFHFILFILFA